MRNQFTPEQEEWLQALESGKYKQGRKWLNKNQSFCCLGVACEVFKERLGIEVRTEGVAYYNEESNIAPEEIVDVLHLRGALGQSLGEEERDFLYELNDHREMSFQEIAAHIRKHPGHYFTNFDL